MMNAIDLELAEVRKVCESQIPGSKVISCVRAMVRIDIIKTKYKQLTLCLQFPETYPAQPLLIELKSRQFSFRFLDGLTKVFEEECLKYVGKPQVMKMVKFARDFLEENPLCVCSDEISRIKKDLLKEGKDELRIKQKTSNVSFKLREQNYFINGKMFIPDNYYADKMEIVQLETNFSSIYQRWFLGQSKEIIRKCNEPPVKKNPKAPPFEVSPSLFPVMQFLVEELHRLPHETCALCNTLAFPTDPQKLVDEPNDSKFVERVYCGHVFHYGCLSQYMKIPPFQGGKPCPKCKQRIYHERWKATPELAEARWAHKEAKRRELEEVVDFLK